MFKNVASQKIQLFAFDTTTNLPKTGDAANITAYVSKDHGAVTVLADTSATEMDSTNAKGVYVFDLAQAETNADELTFSAKSSTANITIVPRLISTMPNRFSTLVVDAAGLVDANTVKLGPSGSGTAQTARDVGASVLLSSGTSAGQISLSSGLVTLAGVTHTGAVIPTVSAVTGLTASNLDATISSRMATYAQPTGFLAATFPTTVASTTNITGGTITTVTNLTNAPTSGDFTSTMKTSITTAATAATPTAAAVTAGVTIANGGIVAASFGSGAIDATAFAQGAADKVWSTATRSLTSLTGFRLSSTGVDDILRTALTEGYAADGAAPTLEQFLFMSWSALSEFSIATTTITAKKLDGTTAAMTFTLDSSTNPTSRTRAT